MKVSSLHVYPIKSLGGIRLDTTKVTMRGLEYDRRWMLVDSQNNLITQRTLPILAKFNVTISTDNLAVIHLQNCQSFKIPIVPTTQKFELVKVWDDTVKAQIVNEETNSWFSDQLSEKVRLVYQPDSSLRPVDNKYQINGNEHTSMSDGYPILVISKASLEDLNKRLETPVEMQKFRPNIVVDGCEAFFEDTLKKVSIGAARLFGVKPCARCIMTTLDHDSLKFGKEPLHTLSKFRKFENKILFGQNMVVHEEGRIKVGDKLMIF